MPSPYDVLGVDEDADEDSVHRAYRRRVMETHPDQGGSEREFRRVREAYERIRTGAAGGDDDGRPGGVREPRRARPTRVEYLDYEVLDDHRWSLDDDDLFRKAAAAGLDPADHGTFEARPDESLLEAAENRGFAWPYACRGGACANCAVAVCSGELSQPVDHILPSDLVECGIRLSCNGVPATAELRVVYYLKHRPDLADLRLPPNRFERAHADD